MIGKEVGDLASRLHDIEQSDSSLNENMDKFLEAKKLGFNNNSIRELIDKNVKEIYERIESIDDHAFSLEKK